jgi:hypothetical protein
MIYRKAFGHAVIFIACGKSPPQIFCLLGLTNAKREVKKTSLPQPGFSPATTQHKQP